MSKRTVHFHDGAWDDYLYWQTHDKKLVTKITKLINECRRTPFQGSGKPEALKHGLSGYWSRRITSEHRLVYGATETAITILSCRNHY